jgi:SAM-dependent methyltransferase
MKVDHKTVGEKPEALVYREPRCAHGYEEDRYGGRFGSFLKLQEVNLYRELLGESPSEVLDAGAGTGKLTVAFLETGSRVASTDFSLEMLRIARANAPETASSAVFCVADLQALCFRDRAFDCTVSSRVLMHLTNWRRGLAELCRVTRRTLVFDVPARLSFAGIESFWRRKLGFRSPSGAPSYEAVMLRDVRETLARSGFSMAAVHRTFFLPAGLHRRLDRPELTTKVEGFLGRIGLTRLFGNPITVKALRNDLMHNSLSGILSLFFGVAA